MTAIGTSASTDAFKYWAFISYSHQDRAWADWLHRTLESYHVPFRLAGRASRDGKIPRRLAPIFRDRDELPTSADLGATINEALNDSRYQIVICSPRAAASRWVNEEVKHFKSLGRDDRVLCLIVDGEPNVFDVPGRDIEECFCPALRFKVSEKGEITTQPAEPIAADARTHTDGKSGAKLKLVAGLLGVGLDELKQRERQRQLLRGVGWAALAALFIVSLAGVWRWQQHQRTQQARYERLDRLVELGRRELLRQQSARAAAYLSSAYSSGRDTAAVRFMLARALPSVEALTPVHGNIGIDAGFVSGEAHVAFSADGRRFVSTIGRTAKIWDAESGKLLVTLATPTAGDVHKVLFAADGKRVLISGLDYGSGAVSWVTHVWDSGSGAELARLDGLALPNTQGTLIRGNAFAPADATMQRVVTIARDGHARIWEASTGRLMRTLPGTGESISASFSSDGARIVTGNTQGVVTIHDAGTGAVQCSLESTPPTAAFAFFSPDGRTLYSSSARGVITIFDSQCGGARGGFGGLAHSITNVNLTSDGGTLLEAGDREFAVWNLKTRVLQTLYAVDAASSEQIWSMSPSRDGSLLLSAGGEGGVKLWDVNSGRVAAVLDAHVASVSFAGFNPAMPQILSLSRDGEFRIWSPNDLAAQPQRILRHGPTRDAMYGQGTYRASFDATGERVASAGTDGRVKLWDAYSGKEILSLSAHSSAAQCVDFSEDGSAVVTCGADGSAKVWDAATGKLRITVQSPDQKFRDVGLTPDGRTLVTGPAPGGTNPTVRVWDVATGSVLAELKDQHGSARLDLSPSGESFATGGTDGRVNLWSTRDARLLWSAEGHHGAVRSIRYKSDGSRILTTGVDGSARIWNVQEGAEVSGLASAEVGQLGVARWSRRSTLIALGSQGGSIVLWDPAADRKLPLVGHTQAVTDLGFSPDDRLLASSAFDGTVRIWDVATGMLLTTWFSDSSASWAAYPWQVQFSPDGNQLLSAGLGDSNAAAIWDVYREIREPDDVAAIVRCNVPWAVEGEALVPHALESEGCL